MPSPAGEEVLYGELLLPPGGRQNLQPPLSALANLALTYSSVLLCERVFALPGAANQQPRFQQSTLQAGWVGVVYLKGYVLSCY